MSWTHGWWTRISSPIDVGRDSLARLVGRVGGGQCASDDDARLRDVEPTLRRIIGESASPGTRGSSRTSASIRSTSST